MIILDNYFENKSTEEFADTRNSDNGSLSNDLPNKLIIMDPEEKDSLNKNSNTKANMDNPPFVDPEARPTPNTPIQASPVPSDTTPAPIPAVAPAKLSRKDRMAQKDKDNLSVEAAKRGIDLDNPGKEELTDDYKNRLIDATKAAAGQDLADKHAAFVKLLNPPPTVPVPKLDQKALLESEKRQRHARLGDALTAFGEGLQGKTVNPDNFMSTKIQRARDKEFQDYKDATERNKNAKWAWENKNTNDTMDWLDEQIKEEGIDKDRKANLLRLQDQLEKNQKWKELDLAETKRYHTGMLNKSTGKTDKANQPLIVRTEDGVDHSFEPQETSLRRSDVMSHPDQYPELFDKVVVPDTESKTNGETIPGRTTFKLRNGVTTSDILRAHLKNNTPKSSTPVMDKIRAEQANVKAKQGTQPAPAQKTLKPSMFQ